MKKMGRTETYPGITDEMGGMMIKGKMKKPSPRHKKGMKGKGMKYKKGMGGY
jgi:hypothetical protein